ncbi:MAG: hypothetical protein HC888_14395, partial [Candidatus Competibacteraceae bacterium]|nr:hypothetical protein [Candidatus Competibacteraceae bacterium]
MRSRSPSDASLPAGEEVAQDLGGGVLGDAGDIDAQAVRGVLLELLRNEGVATLTKSATPAATACPVLPGGASIATCWKIPATNPSERVEVDGEVEVGPEAD